MAFKDNLPTNVEGWKQELIYRMQLSSGITEPLGPNIMQVISLTAELLHAQNMTLIDLINNVTIKTKSLDQIMEERGLNGTQRQTRS